MFPIPSHPRLFAALSPIAAAPGSIDSISKAFPCHAFVRNPQETCALMTENSPLFGSQQGAEALRGASATGNDISLLQKAANVKKLSLAKACIWRISVHRKIRA